MSGWSQGCLFYPLGYSPVSLFFTLLLKLSPLARWKLCSDQLRPLGHVPLTCPSCFEHIPTFWCHGCELILHFLFCSLRSPAFVFVLRMVFRHQELGTRRAHCYGGGVAFRPSEPRKLGNTCMSVTPVHTHAHICVCAFVPLRVSACVHMCIHSYVN